MQCIDLKVLLSGYLDGALSRDERIEVDRHILLCRECRDLMERAERNDSLVRALCAGDAAFAARMADASELPAGFEERVLARVRSRRRGMRWRRVSGSLGLLTAAAALVLGGTFWVLHVASRTGGNEGARELPGGTGFVDRELPDAFDWDPGFGDVVAGPPRPLVPREEPRLSLRPDELSALHGAAVLLDTIRVTSFDDLEGRQRLRDIATYDELLQRLADVREKLAPADRRRVAAAQASIHELLHGDDDANEWRALQDDLNELGVSEALDNLVNVVDARRAL